MEMNIFSLLQQDCIPWDFKDFIFNPDNYFPAWTFKSNWNTKKMYSVLDEYDFKLISNGFEYKTNNYDLLIEFDSQDRKYQWQRRFKWRIKNKDGILRQGDCSYHYSNFNRLVSTILNLKDWNPNSQWQPVILK